MQQVRRGAVRRGEGLFRRRGCSSRAGVEADQMDGGLGGVEARQPI